MNATHILSWQRETKGTHLYKEAAPGRVTFYLPKGDLQGEAAPEEIEVTVKSRKKPTV